MYIWKKKVFFFFTYLSSLIIHLADPRVQLRCTSVNLRQRNWQLSQVIQWRCYICFRINPDPNCDAMSVKHSCHSSWPLSLQSPGELKEFWTAPSVSWNYLTNSPARAEPLPNIRYASTMSLFPRHRTIHISSRGPFHHVLELTHPHCRLTPRSSHTRSFLRQLK
jgi:hypothetical protein